MTTHRCELVLAALLLATSTARADNASEAAYEEGRRLYDLREWDLAIAKFKEAYRLEPEAKSMFNIAQALRLKGDCVEAIHFYRTYKRNFPKEKNVAKVDKFIVELEPCAKKQGTNSAPPPPPQAQPKADPKPIVQPQPWRQPNPQPDPALQPPPPNLEPAPPPAMRVDKPSNGRGQRGTGIAIGIGGAVLAGVGVYYGLEAQSYADDVANGSGPWDPSIQDAGKSADTRAKIFYGLGAAAIVTGIVVYTMAPRAKRQTIGVAPTPDGAVVVWSGTLR